MAVKFTGRAKAGPVRVSTSRRGVTSVRLKAGPLSWTWKPTKTPAPRPTAAERRELAALHHRWLRRRRALLADLLLAGTLAGLVLGAPRPLLVVLAALAVTAAARWWALARRAATPPTPAPTGRRTPTPRRHGGTS